MLKLKNKTLLAGFWNLFERSYNQLISFVLNVILARLLFPSDYGMIGMIAIFLAISQSFIEGGFLNALIQKQNRTDEDFSTVFYFNILIAFFFYFIFFITAPYVSVFYDVPELTKIMRVITVAILFNSLSIVPRSKLAIRLDFKKQAKATTAAVTISGLLSIFFAHYGFGVWTLVIQSVTLAMFNSLFLILFVKWKPKLVFSYKSFRDLFGFGSKLLVANLFDRIIKNIYFLVIGKFFSTEQLGFYTKADQFSKLPATNIAGLIQSITFPRMCELQGNIKLLRNNYIRNIKIASFLTFPILIYLSVFAKPIVLIALTDKWLQVAPYITLLSIVGMIYPLNFLNMNLFLAKKRSDIYLKLEFLNKSLVIITLLITISMGIKEIIYGQIAVGILSFFINAFFTNKLIGYGVVKQLLDIAPFLVVSFVATMIAYHVTNFFNENIIKILMGFFITFIFFFIIVYTTNLNNIKSDLKSILR